jgi:hypothetical protein
MARREESYVEEEETLVRQSSPSPAKSSPVKQYSASSSPCSPAKINLNAIGGFYQKSPNKKSPVKEPEFMSSPECSPEIYTGMKSRMSHNSKSPQKQIVTAPLDLVKTFSVPTPYEKNPLF